MREAILKLEERGQLLNFKSLNLPKISLKKFLPYFMIAPSLIIFSLFVIYPIFYMIYLSFFKWNLMGDKIYIGLNNFKTMFGDEEFWKVLGKTFQYMGFNLFFTITISLLLAAYIKKESKMNKIFQSIIFTPHIISLVSVSFIWVWLMDSDFGLLNYILNSLGINSIAWLENPEIAIYSLVIVSVWKSVGYNAIMLLSAMNAVPTHLYEAAELDKGSPISVFFKITLPMISPTLFFITLMNMIGSFKVFETVHIMTGGGPMNSTNTLVYNLYENGFKFYKIGYASAQGVILMIIIGIATVCYFKFLEKKVHYR